MKKLLLMLGIFVLAGCAGGKHGLKADLSLLQTFEEAQRLAENQYAPYIALYKKDGKTLIYLATAHNLGITSNMVDYIFANYKPQVAVIEFERSGRHLDSLCSRNEFVYSAQLATDAKIPVVFADLTEDDYNRILIAKDPQYYTTYQALWMARNAMFYEREFNSRTTLSKELVSFEHHGYNSEFGPLMTEDEAKEWFKKHYDIDFDTTSFSEFFSSRDVTSPSGKSVFNLYSQAGDLYGRDPFMLKNIEAALNKYNIVYAAFGEGHYRAHKKVLDDMMGEPEIILNEGFNRRHVCDAFKVNKEVLVP